MKLAHCNTHELKAMQNYIHMLVCLVSSISNLSTLEPIPIRLTVMSEGRQSCSLTKMRSKRLRRLFDSMPFALPS